MAAPGIRPARSGGVTLIELLVAVGILAMLAASIPPLISATSRPTQAIEAAGQIAAALRFARDEALRTQTPYGVTFTSDTASDSYKVYVLNTATAPPTPLYTVRHPLSRQLYADTLGSGSRYPDARLDSNLVVLPSGTAGALSFLADGAPATTQGNALQRLASGSARVRVQAGSHTRDVLVAAETGRITFQ